MSALIADPFSDDPFRCGSQGHDPITREVYPCDGGTWVLIEECRRCKRRTSRVTRCPKEQRA